jgi:hypothetical protein
MLHGGFAKTCNPKPSICYRCVCLEHEVIIVARERKKNETVDKWLAALWKDVDQDHHARNNKCKISVEDLWYVRMPHP